MVGITLSTLSPTSMMNAAFFSSSNLLHSFLCILVKLTQELSFHAVAGDVIVVYAMQFVVPCHISIAVMVMV